MELTKKYIHMDQMKCQNNAIVTLEDDLNLAQEYPDIDKILFSEGFVTIEGVKPTTDHVQVKGYLEVSVLYLSEEEDERLARTNGKISFDQTVFLEGVTPTDNVDISYQLEDLSPTVINSRKLGIRAVVNLKLSACQILDQEVATDISQAQGLEIGYKKLDYTKLAICKKDVLRLKENIELPASMPNMQHLVFESCHLCAMDFRPLDNKIIMNGQLQIFLVYESGSDEDNLHYYETKVPISTALDCEGALEEMMADISTVVTARECEVRPDFDGEERIYSVEMTIELAIALYQEESISILSDVYSTSHETKVTCADSSVRKLVMMGSGICPVEESVQLEGAEDMLQLLYSTGQAQLLESEITSQGVKVSGVIHAKCLYVTNDDKMPYGSISLDLPFSYLLEGKNLSSDMLCKLQLQLRQLEVTVSEKEKLQIRGVACISALIFAKEQANFITEIALEPLSKKKLSQMPGVVIYVVKEGDTLWSIGKQYYISVQRIMQWNQLTDTTVEKGKKLLLVSQKTC